MLKTPLKLLLAASIALPGAVLGSAANAGPRGHHHYSHHYYGGYYYGYYPYHGYSRHHGRAGTYLGVALLGLGLGYVLSKSHDEQYRHDYYRDQRNRDDYYRNQDYRGNYAAPPPPGYSGAKPQNQQPTYQGFDFSQCQETREYQTTILIDGEEQQAFGTACLMPDGTWVAGPMQIQ